MPLYTAKMAAVELGMEERTVRNLARRHGIGEMLNGTVWIFNNRDLKRLREHKAPRPKVPAR